MLDLFGQKIAEPQSLLKHGRKSTVPRGYAAAPGTGPVGETCKTCKHYALKRMSRTYRKCALMQAIWTCGPGTDIKARSPACGKWECDEN